MIDRVSKQIRAQQRAGQLPVLSNEARLVIAKLVEQFSRATEQTRNHGPGDDLSYIHCQMLDEEDAWDEWYSELDPPYECCHVEEVGELFEKLLAEGIL